MCDFDIASFRNQSVKRLKKKKPKSKAKAKEEDRDAKENGANEFALRLQKRRLLGLDVTDSESSSSDSDSGTKKKGRKKKPKLEYQAFAKLMRSDSSDDDDTEKNNSNNSRKDASSSSAAQEAAENDGESKPEQEPEKEEGPYIDPDLILLSDEELTETPSHSRRPTTRSHRLQLEEQRPSTTPEKRSLSPDIPTMPLDDLDPELAMLAASPVESTSDTGPRKVQIKVQFINLQTTDDPNLRAFLNSISKPVKVIVMDNEPFDLMLTHYCKRKLLKKDEMILVYQDVPVVLRATPASLNMLPDTKNIVYVYKRADYERKIAQEAQEKEERFRRLAIDPTSEEFIGKYLPEEPRPSGEPVEEDKRMLIKLRGKDKHDVTLRVKKNTLLRNVVKHYIQVRKLDSSMEDKISLSFEGEVLSLDDTIENTELEDQDMISVTIKT